jgi:hypothetical protein
LSGLPGGVPCCSAEFSGGHPANWLQGGADPDGDLRLIVAFFIYAGGRDDDRENRGGRPVVRRAGFDYHYFDVFRRARERPPLFSLFWALGVVELVCGDCEERVFGKETTFRKTLYIRQVGIGRKKGIEMMNVKRCECCEICELYERQGSDEQRKSLAEVQRSLLLWGCLSFLQRLLIG